MVINNAYYLLTSKNLECQEKNYLIQLYVLGGFLESVFRAECVEIVETASDVHLYI